MANNPGYNSNVQIKIFEKCLKWPSKKKTRVLRGGGSSCMWNEIIESTVNAFRRRVALSIQLHSKALEAAGDGHGASTCSSNLQMVVTHISCICFSQYHSSRFSTRLISSVNMGQINHLLNTAVPVTMVLLIVEEEQDRLGLEAVTI